MSKEVLTQSQEQNKGVVDRVLKGGEKVSKVTLFFGAGGFVLSAAVGMVPLAAFALGSAAFDGGQLMVISEIQRRRKKKPVEGTAEKSGTLAKFPQTRGEVSLPKAA